MNKPALPEGKKHLLDVIEGWNFESNRAYSHGNELQASAGNTTEMPWHSDILSARKQNIENGEARFISLEELKEHYNR